MPPDNLKRKLTTILSADVKGYSRLMGEDEEWTLRTLNSYKGLIRNLVGEHRGRVVGSPGDNVLAEFASVVDAVECAVEIQQVLRAKNALLPETRKMNFRIGINLGDVIEEEDSIYGDGVNIAARLEALAVAGGICISGSAYEQVENKIPLRYDYLGEREVKNIAKPVRVYRVQIEPEGATEKRAKPRPWPMATIGLVIVVVVAILIWKFYIPSTPQQIRGTPARTLEHHTTQPPKTSKEVFKDNFDNGYGNWDSSMKFGGTISLVAHGDGKAVRVNRSNIQGNNFTRLSYKIPIHAVKGQHVMLQAMVKTENIEIGKEHFHGGRIDFEIMTPTGVHYAGCELVFTGSFDWTMHSFECDIPADVSAISLRIGLQGAKGAIYFDDIRVFRIE